MRATFRKLEVKDIHSLERLVAENAEGVEPGLKIVDSRLVLGQAAIDLVGLDSKGSLVLIALDFSAHDGLLLRVMDAYSWCLEYPDTLRRLYPMAQATSRPPRVLFIVERMTDAFVRRMKQLSFLEIDCFEFRHLEVNGASVAYFDLVERVRKIVESTDDDQAQLSAAPIFTAEPASTAAPAPVTPPVAPVVERPVEPVKPEPVKSAIEWPKREPASEPKRVDPPRVVVFESVPTERPVAAAVAPEPIAPVIAVPSAPAPVVEPKSVVEVPTPAAVSEFQSVTLVSETPATALPTPAPVAAPTPADPALALEAIQKTSTRAQTNGHVPEPAVALVIEPTSQVSVPVAERVAAPATVVATPPIVEAPVVVAPASPVVAAPLVITAATGAVPEPVPVLAPAAPAPVAPAAPAFVAPAPMAPAQPAPAPVHAPVWAKPGSQPNGARPQFFAQATKGAPPVEAPAIVAAVAATAEPASQPAASKVGLDDRPELESLSFPKDGLSRQWLEFLSQLGATK
jgi:hypothetical protein